MEFAWPVLSRSLYETSMDGVVASDCALGSAEHFPKGRRSDRKIWDAHAEIEGFYFTRRALALRAIRVQRQFCRKVSTEN